jgi:hypothetical protein
MPASFRQTDTANVNITTRSIARADADSAVRGEASIPEMVQAGVIEPMEPIQPPSGPRTLAGAGLMVNEGRLRVDLRAVNNSTVRESDQPAVQDTASTSKAPKPPVSFAPDLAAVYKQSIPGVPGLIEASVTNGFMVVPVGDVSGLLTDQARKQLGLGDASATSSSKVQHINTCVSKAFATAAGSRPFGPRRKQAGVCRLLQPEGKPAACMFVVTPEGVSQLPRVVYADTASDCTIIKGSRARAYNVAVQELPERTVHMSTVGGVFSQPMVVTEPVTLLFNKGGRELRVRVSMLVADVDALPYDIILGTPLLNMLGTEIDFKSESMRIFPRYAQSGDVSVSLDVPLSIVSKANGSSLPLDTPVVAAAKSTPVTDSPCSTAAPVLCCAQGASAL